MADQKFPGNPTQSYRTRTREPVEVVGEQGDWIGHAPVHVQSMRNALATPTREGLAVVDD